MPDLHTSMTIRADELKVGDRFKYEDHLVTVNHIDRDEDWTTLHLEYFVLGRCEYRQATYAHQHPIYVIR
jgi:hypothetical protein